LLTPIEKSAFISTVMFTGTFRLEAATFLRNLTKSMQLSPSCEAASRSFTKKFSKIFWNPKVHYRVHKSMPLAAILSQMNPVNITASYLSTINFNIIPPPMSRSS
jgi:hypothetical protein